MRATAVLIGLTFAVHVPAATGAAETEYDLVVVGATPGGIACAVRAAREGLDVLLVSHTQHLGGLPASGLGVWDTLYEGRRAPIYDELRWGIFDDYRRRYGEDSAQYRECLPGPSGHTNGKFEAHVFERVATAMVDREANVAVLKGLYPVEAEREGALVRAVTLREMDGTKMLRVTAKVFADCTYEGDLAAVCKAPYRVGREAREEHGEPHAGRVFLRRAKGPAPESEAASRAAKLRAGLKLRRFVGRQEVLLPESTGEGDGAVQAYNYRTVLSSDPANRILPEKPEDYDPAFLRTLEYGSIVRPIPNRKIGWNRPQLVGPHQPYVEGSWATRRRAMDRHWEATLALLYFLQNDPSVPAEKREFWGRYGLARDEFADHGHRPYEIYVREARRIVGRYVFTEHDALLAPGLDRAPVHGDSIGVTEWYLDTHACHTDRVRGSLHEGKMMLHEETWPGQVPYRCLLPRGLDNLLVPVCLSSSHVAWGTIRLEPTWMNVAESAGYAAALAVKTSTPPAEIDVDRLLQRLADGRVMIALFNDVDMAGDEPWVPAVEYLGTKGFFASYDAAPNEPLTEAVARCWSSGLAAILAGTVKPNELASSLCRETAGESATAVTWAGFRSILRERLATRAAAIESLEAVARRLALRDSASPTRAEACRLLYEALKAVDKGAACE